MIRPAGQAAAYAWLKAQEAPRGREQCAYDPTALRAPEDLESALVSWGHRSLVEQSAASRRAAELVRIPCREGGVDFLVLPNAGRSPLIADDALSVARTSVNTDAIATCKARGRGWKQASA